jgi:hypothetical protein
MRKISGWGIIGGLYFGVGEVGGSFDWGWGWRDRFLGLGRKGEADRGLGRGKLGYRWN